MARHNLAKRQVKAPKIYIHDSGLLHLLLGVTSRKGLLEHPKVGASWEGFVVEQVLKTESHDDAYFWATHQGADIDLILYRGGRLLAIECKRIDASRMTPSIWARLRDLGLARIVIVYPSIKRYPIADRVEAIPLERLADDSPLFPVDAA